MPGTATFNETYPFNPRNTIDISAGLSPVSIAGQINEANRIDALLVTNTDTIDHVVQFSLDNGGNIAFIAVVTVPAGSGTGVIQAFDCLPAFPVSLQAGIALAANDSLFANVEVAMVGASYLGFTVMGGRL